MNYYSFSHDFPIRMVSLKATIQGLHGFRDAWPLARLLFGSVQGPGGLRRASDLGCSVGSWKNMGFFVVSTWGFPEIGDTPKSFILRGFFWKKESNYIEVPPFMENPTFFFLTMGFSEHLVYGFCGFLVRWQLPWDIGPYTKVKTWSPRLVPICLGFQASCWIILKLYLHYLHVFHGHCLGIFVKPGLGGFSLPDEVRFLAMILAMMPWVLLRWMCTIHYKKVQIPFP